MRRAILLALVCAAVAVSVLAVRATDRDRPGSAGAAATPTTPSAPAQHPADRTCRQIPLPVPPARLALMDRRLLVASREARSIGVAEVHACRWLGTIVQLPSRAKVTPPPPQAGVINGPDRPYALAADRHSLWVVGELTLYHYDLASGRLTAQVPLPGLAVVLARGMLWAANLIEGPTFVYGIDARTRRFVPNAGGTARSWPWRRAPERSGRSATTGPPCCASIPAAGGWPAGSRWYRTRTGRLRVGLCLGRAVSPVHDRARRP